VEQVQGLFMDFLIVSAVVVPMGLSEGLVELLLMEPLVEQLVASILLQLA
jgi:hypothetical protein